MSGDNEDRFLSSLPTHFVEIFRDYDRIALELVATRKQYEIMEATLRRTQAECTRLLLENRNLNAGLNARFDEAAHKLGNIVGAMAEAGIGGCPIHGYGCDGDCDGDINDEIKIG